MPKFDRNYDQRMRDLLLSKAPMEMLPPDVVVIPGVNLQPANNRIPKRRAPLKGRHASIDKAKTIIQAEMELVFVEHIRDFCDRENMSLGAFFTHAARLLFERLDR